MAFNKILGVLGTAASGAYKAYKAAEEKQRKENKTSSDSTNKITPKYNEHQQYIQDTHPGGYDDYKRIQQERYNTAYRTGDYDLMSKLDEDALRVGYSLIVPQNQQIQQPKNQQTQPIYNNPYDSYIDDINDRYSAIDKKITDANKAAVQQSIGRLQNQIPGLNQGYDEAARQAYIMNMQSRKMLPQRLALQGATGGATETANLGLDTSYQNNLSNINLQRQNSLNEIGNAITDIQNAGDLATVEQILQNNQSALAAYQNMINNSASYNQWMANYQANRDDARWGQDYQVGRDNINDLRYDNETASALKQQEYNNILTRLGMGLISPNDAVTLGVPAQDVQAFVERIIATQNAELANTNSLINKRNTGNNNENIEDDNPVLSTADKYLAQGNRQKAIEALTAIYTNEQIKQYLESKGYRTDDIDWGIEESPINTSQFLPERLPTNPLSTESIAAFLRSQGLSDEEIAVRLNRN